MLEVIHAPDGGQAQGVELEADDVLRRNELAPSIGHRTFSRECRQGLVQHLLEERRFDPAGGVYDLGMVDPDDFALGGRGGD